MRRKRPLPIVMTLTLLMGVLVISSCARASQTSEGQEPGITVALQVVPPPPTTGESELVITLTDAAGQRIRGASLAIKGDMSHAGMTPVLANISEDVEGTYTVPFTWTMAGDWIVTVVATLPDGRVVTRRFQLVVSNRAGG